jgi:hypothetical protein
MLKTNSKKASENLKAYILEHADGTNYGVSLENENFSTVAKFIYNCFIDEKYKGAESYYTRQKMSLQDVFEEWASGLPSVLDTCYYYNRSAVDDLAAILEQTETEKAKYNEQESEKLLTCLIFREIKKAV